MLNVILYSLGKSFKTLGLVAAAAGAAVIANPEIVAPLFVSTGPIGLLVVMAVNFGGQTLLDVLKHRNEEPE